MKKIGEILKYTKEDSFIVNQKLILKLIENLKN